MSKIKKIIEWAKAHYIMSAIILIVVLFVGYKIFAGNSVAREEVVVSMGDVTQKVIVSGKTKPVDSVDLGFETNGKVVRSFIDVGDRVTVGQKLVELDSSEVYANYLKSQANLASEQAKLDEIKKGTRPEEIAIAETQVANAQTDLNDAMSNMASKMLDAYAKSDDVIHNNADQFFTNPRTNPQINLVTLDSQLKNDAEQARFRLEATLLIWKDNVATGKTISVSKINADLIEVKNFLDKMATMVNSQTTSSGTTQTTLDTYKASISSARSSILTSISTISTAEEKLNSAKSALTLAQRNLDLKKGGNTPEAIKSAEARVMQFEADLQNASAQLKKMTLYSPLNGVVTKQDAKVGEIMTPSQSVVSIISDSDLEIESNVSEINIGKVAVGNPVIITMDAFPGEKFAGTVTYIEPAETIIDGVVNYKVKIAFAEKYTQMKSGLTTNLEIITSVKVGVIRVPQYALVTKDAGTFVTKKENKKMIEVPVTVGLVGQDGFVEIISGVAVGDTVVMPE
jgi:HlyD family secretion protein